MSTILEKKKEKQSTLFDSGFIRKISAGQHEADKEKTMQAISKKHAEEVERKTQVLAEKKRKRKINEARVWKVAKLVRFKLPSKKYFIIYK
jgi:hypothetical protein